MAQDTVTVPANAWTLLTNSDVSTARIQNQGSSPVYIQARNGTGAVTLPGSILLDPKQGMASLDLAVEFVGVTSASRLYAWSLNGTQVSISHA